MNVPLSTQGEVSAGDGGVPASGKSLLPFDILRVGLHVVRGWKWILLAALIGGGAALVFGWVTFTTKYTAQVQLVRREVQNNFQASELGESFRPRQFNVATVSSMMRSGALMEKTGAALKPPVSAAVLDRGIVIRPEKNTDLITVAWTTDTSAARAVEAVNKYAENVVELTRELQAEEAKELLTFITSQLDRTDADLAAVQKEMMAFSRESGLYNADKETESYLKQISELELKIETARIEHETIDYRSGQIEKELARQDPGVQRLREAKERLAELLTQYTPKHPDVIEQQARVKAMELKTMQPGAGALDSFQSTGNTVANNLYLEFITLRGRKESLQKEVESLKIYRDQVKAKLDGIPDKSLAQARIKARAAPLEETRNLLTGRQREAQLFAVKALGYYRLFAPASVESVEVSSRTIKMIITTLAGALLAASGVMGWRALRAALNDTIVSPSDVRRLTKTQLVASLPQEDTMDAAAQARWRFAAWASFVRSVPAPPEGALVAGLLSAADGEGKSTWLRHLGRAALDRGLKVLAVTHGASTGAQSSSVPLEQGLAHPDKVAAHLRSAQPAALELNAPASWVWTAATRQQWREALGIWSQEPGLVVLVELPASSELDSLLLAETLPAVLWLSESGRLRREQVTGIIKAIQASGVKLIGSLLNRIPPVFQKLPDLARFGLCIGLVLIHSTSGTDAQETTADDIDPPPPAIHGSLPPVSNPVIPAPLPAAGDLRTPTVVPPPPLSTTSKSTPAVPVRSKPGSKTAARPPLAAWQERLTLGPGDLVNLQVYGKKEFTRTEVPVGPDGTITYLQVHDFKAAGLTIDELREALTKELQAFIQNAQIIVTPSAYRSKKYYLLGTIMDRGAFTLDRPMTLLEAAARARGIATGLLEQNTVEIADMRRAFIVRGGKKLNVDFTKLFYEGDTSQNILLQPGDYIYFPSNIVNEVYILGAVRSPGHTGVTENLTALGAITIRGGFTPAAWRRKVIVIRGSLETSKRVVMEVDAAAVMTGRQKDVILEPRDLVYVAEKPWQRAEEILDLALRAFVQTGTATWTGNNVGPLITKPLVPSVR